MGLVDAVLEMFGPFLIPVVVFAVGVAFYVFLWFVGEKL
jgi:hypothetical protein